MQSLLRRSLLVLIVLLVPGFVSAQGLGDAAAKERQKRQTAPKTKARLITNDDLKTEESGKPKSGSDGASPVTEPTPSPGNYQSEREAPRSGGDGDSREKEVEQAQQRVDSARSAVVAAEARVKELGDKLNPMSPSFIYAQGQAGDAAGEEIRTREALKGADAQLTAARDALVKANQDFEDVRQGRRPRSSDR